MMVGLGPARALGWGTTFARLSFRWVFISLIVNVKKKCAHGSNGDDFFRDADKTGEYDTVRWTIPSNWNLM